jgi:hypothetical protein
MGGWKQSNYKENHGIMRILLIVLLGVLLTTSCGKKRSIHITATNAATGERYAGLQYFIVSSSTGADGEKYKTEKSGFLNENGEASEIIREKQYRTYSVRVVEPENSCYNKVITMYFGSPNDEDGHFNFEFAECAYMRQNIININCEGATDIFNIRDRFTYTEWSGWSIDLLGCYSNTGGDYFKVPAGKRYFHWRVNRPSGVIEHIDSIELAPGEYGDLNINY